MRESKGKRGRIEITKLIGWLSLWILWSTAHAQKNPRDSVYQLRAGREMALVATGGVVNGVGLILDQKMVALTPEQIALLNPQRVNALDRGATRNWSTKAARISDLTLLSTLGVVGITGLVTLNQRKWFTVPLLYAETMLLTVGTTEIVKNATLRSRPFVYNTAAPLSDKLEKDARRSLFSGHASGAFASAVFASTVFGHYFPVSKLKPVVWAGSLGLATATSILRYQAGKHYPTDLLVGAAVGSAFGLLVPQWHRPKNPNKRPRDLTMTPWSNGYANGVYVRMAIN